MTTIRHVETLQRYCPEFPIDNCTTVPSLCIRSLIGDALRVAAAPRQVALSLVLQIPNPALSLSSL
jgi:hypothetical protein